MGELIVASVDLIGHRWLWPATSEPGAFSRTAPPLET